MTQEIADRLTPVTTQEMADALSRAWACYMGAPPDNSDSVRILLAQWALETGWGKSMHNFNVGNVKARVGGDYDWQFFRCNEVIDGKIVWFNPPNPGCCFRAFTALDDGALDHLVLLVNHRTFSRAWPAVISGDPARYAHLLKQAGYYTADETQYAANVASIFHSLQSVTVAQADELSDQDKGRISQLVALSLSGAQDEISRWHNPSFDQDETI